MEEKTINFTPINDRVLVLPMKVDDRTTTGLLIPEASKGKSQKGTVMAVSSEWVNNGCVVSPRVKVGDIVLFEKFSGTEILLDDVQFLVMREADIYGILR